MSIRKGPTEGGSGGTRGHSNMEHWGYTEEVNEAAKRRRRIEDKQAAREELELELELDSAADSSAAQS
jgi:hypothetical protein